MEEKKKLDKLVESMKKIVNPEVRKQSGKK